MSGALIIFILSGCGLVFFLILKALQVQLGTLLLFPEFRNRIEANLQQKLATMQMRAGRIETKNVYIVLHYLLRTFRRLLAKLEYWADHRSSRLLSRIRGKQGVERRGRASTFLHDVGSFKDRFRGR